MAVTQDEVLDLFGQVSAIKNSDQFLLISATSGGSYRATKITAELVRTYLIDKFGISIGDDGYIYIGGDKTDKKIDDFAIELDFDDEPTAGSLKAVTSDGIYKALQNVYSETELVVESADYTYENKYIGNSSTGYPNGTIVEFGTGTYELWVFAVSANKKWNLQNTSSTAVGATFYALYSCDNVADIGSANVISYSGKITKGEMNADITIPQNAKWLAVTKYSQATLVVSKEETKSLIGEVEALADDVSEMRGEIDEIASQKGHVPMRIKRNGDNVYLAYNNGNGIELCYLFGSIYTSPQTGWGLKRVYNRIVQRQNPVADTFSDATMMCSCVSTDMIGPVSIDGTWCGGAHSITVNGTKQSSMIVESKSVVADGVIISSGDEMDCYKVIITVVNKILAPDGTDMLEETVAMTVVGGTMDVHVTHNYKYNGGVGRTIKTYYGMQSVFGTLNDSKILTVNGKFPKLTTMVSAMGFNKGDYPNFSRYVIKRNDGWCQSTGIDTSIGIGDHSLINDDDKIFVSGDTSNKMYHRLIANKVITAGMTYEWAGTYKWEFDNGVSVADDLANQDVSQQQSESSPQSVYRITATGYNSNSTQSTLTISGSTYTEARDVLQNGGIVEMTIEGAGQNFNARMFFSVGYMMAGWFFDSTQDVFAPVVVIWNASNCIAIKSPVKQKENIVVMLSSMGSMDDSQTAIHVTDGLVYNVENHTIDTKSNNVVVSSEQPSANNIYVNLVDNKCYRYSGGSSGSMIKLK